jgi:hypothetical protein
MICENIRNILATAAITTMGMGTTPHHTMRGIFRLP